MSFRSKAYTKKYFFIYLYLFFYMMYFTHATSWRIVSSTWLKCCGMVFDVILVPNRGGGEYHGVALFRRNRNSPFSNCSSSLGVKTSESSYESIEVHIHMNFARGLGLKMRQTALELGSRLISTLNNPLPNVTL